MQIAESVFPDCFNRQFNSLFKKYPRSKASVQQEIDKITNKPSIGDRIPGFNPLYVYKFRIALKEYNIGQRQGLRVIYLVVDKCLIMIAIYYKGDYRSETETLRMIRKHIKEAIAKLDQQP